MRFELTSEAIVASDPSSSEGVGAVVAFEGRVRNLNENRQVLSLEYEAYDDLALKTGSEVLSEAVKRFPISDASCIHRVGHLQLGEVAILVEVAAGHRQEAFEACRWIVDEVKARVPIWKKEHYANGDSEWLNASADPHPPAPSPRTTHLGEGESLYYSRQALLKEIDQERLSSARVLVVGAGGLGSPVVEYLSGAGIGQLTIVDGDCLEESNLHRQVLFSHRDIGQPKAKLAAERARKLNPYIHVDGVPQRLSPSNATDLTDAHDLVLDCTDNFATKFLLNDVCVARGKPLVIASIYQFEGQVMVVVPGGPCLRCLWPQAPDEGCVGSCAEAGVLGVAPGVFGTLQGNEALKLLLGLPSPLRGGKILLLDLIQMDQQLIRVVKNLACPACGCGQAEDDLEVFEPAGVLVDIREEDEIAAGPLPGALVLPMSRFDPAALPHAERYVLVCAHGVRSAYLARAMRAAGDCRFYSLAGGTSRLRP